MNRWLGAALSGLLTVAAGCGADQTTAECPTTPVPGVAIAVGARANSPAPVLPPEVLDLIERAIRDGRGITLVRVDGAPTIACALRFRSDAENQVARDDDERRFRTQVRAAVAALRAREPGADPLAALTIAADAAGPEGVVVLLDSGLQTRPPLDFREDGLLDQALSGGPAAVVPQLREAGMLPDLTGRAVTLAGIGYPADPQPRLDQGRRQGLVQLWQGIAEAAGAQPVTVVTAARTDGAVTGVPEVEVVDIPPPGNIALGCDTRSVLYDTGPVGFRPDSTEFVDPEAAREALRDFAQWLAGNPTGQAELTGNIAHYGANERDHGLALHRAEAVRAELIRLGAEPEQVRASGGGWGPHPEPGASADPRYDPLNRRVVVTLRC